MRPIPRFRREGDGADTARIPRESSGAGFFDWVTQLVHRHRSRLVRVVRREGLGAEDALDCVQDAFYGFLAFPQARALVEEPDDSAKLLTVLARNVAQNRRRRPTALDLIFRTRSLSTAYRPSPSPWTRRSRKRRSMRSWSGAWRRSTSSSAPWSPSGSSTRSEARTWPACSVSRRATWRSFSVAPRRGYGAASPTRSDPGPMRYGREDVRRSESPPRRRSRVPPRGPGPVPGSLAR